MARRRAIRGLLAAVLTVFVSAPGLAQDAAPDTAQNAVKSSAVGLRNQVRALAEAEGIAVTGLERIDPVVGRRTVPEGSLERRLHALLAGFNFVIFHDQGGQVSGIRVMGAGRPGPPRLAEASVPATRQGAHFLVDTVLIGPTGLWANRRLIVDTGASTVVLPTSTIPSLGLRDSDLTLGTVETAGGTVPARIGALAAVRVGHAEVKDVPVTFIADEHLGQKALLGMSFLDHFRLTVDEAGQRIILDAK